MGGRHVSRRRISRAQQTKNWCVGFSFPPPAYAGIHPTLYLFGFRANALNSHSPPYLPGFDPGSGLRCFRAFSGLFRGFGAFRPKPFGACGGLRPFGIPPNAPRSETIRGLVPVRALPGASGGLRGPSGRHLGSHWVW